MFLSTIPAVKIVCWKTTLLGASMLYGKNCDEIAMESTLRCSKDRMITDLDSQWPMTGIRGPTHQPVIIPTVAATTMSGMKYPANKGLIVMS